jgi:hypothetical protein
MRALLGLILLVTAPLAARAQASDAAFTPDTVLQMPGGPRIVVLRSDPGGVAALRLSIPFVETAAEAGAGRMLAALAERRMAGVARQVGSRVSASRTPWGLAYSVEGAEADLDYLAYLLRLATAQPRPENGIVELIRAELILDLERQDESPGDRLLADLRRATAPDLSPLGGSHSSVRLLDQARLRAVWQRTHLAPSMSLVAMTSASAVTLLAMLEQIGLPKVEVTEPMNAPDSGVVNRGPPPPGSWYAEARVDHAVADPHAAVAAHLLAQNAAGSGTGLDLSVRVWQLRDRSLLVVAGTALSRPAITSLKETVLSALADFSDSLDAHQVALAVGRVGREYRARARTPGGLVEQVGHMADRTGGSSDASLYLAGLGRVTAESLAAYLDGLGAPVAVESAR